MKIQAALLAASGLILASAASAQTTGTPILAATTSEETYRAMALYWGVHPMLVPFPQDTDEMIENAVAAAVHQSRVVDGDLVVITAGTPIGVPGSTNLIKVHSIGQALQQPARQSK